MSKTEAKPQRNEKGQFGAGNTSGGRSKVQADSTRYARQFAADHKEQIMERLLSAALDSEAKGQGAALRELARILIPAGKPAMECVRFTMPRGGTLEDIAMSLVRAVAGGSLPPDVGTALISALNATAAIKERDLAGKLDEAEKLLKSLSGGSRE